tara:strand:+ start:732 stop:1403 length:672 start_codon:yes stop_codon:yes gene_type:complete
MIRFFDIFFSVVAIFFLSPLFVFVIFLLRFSGEGEIFYYQKRVGKAGNIFNVLKFATMLKNSPNIGSKNITIQNDPRVLPLGKLLRKTKINELPQLLNVLIGDMGLIGYRPLTPDQTELYSKKGKEYIYINKPGLSGVGSIIFRNEEEILGKVSNPENFHKTVIIPYKEEIEIWYSKNTSLLNYFVLIYLTIESVMIPRSKRLWRMFPELPKPNNRLFKFIGP